MDVEKENVQKIEDEQKASESGKSNEKGDAERIFCHENFLKFGNGDRRALCNSCSKWANIESAEVDVVIQP